MGTNREQAPCNQSAKSLLYALLLLILPLSIHAADSEEPAPEIEAPDNWYQVEVILFTQNGNIGGEAPPQDYQLNFPENWVQLVDPNMPLEQDGFPLARGSLLYPANPDDSERVIPLIVVADPLTTESETADRMLPSGSEGIEQAPESDAPEDQYAPEYEAPFVLLDREFRDLNDSAAALDRRQYNVVFHEAWRFAAEQDTVEQDAADPWVIIKAGQSLEGRFQLEGSLRFYKSRFLHFESDLWLLQFANASKNESVKRIELPDFPRLPDITEDQLAPDYVATDLKQAIGAQTPAFVIDDLEDPAIQRVELTNIQDSVPQDPDVAVIDALEVAATQTLNTSVLAIDEAKKYPVETVWVLKKSKRLEENSVYYIDHPEMGIMLTIKAFTPELLNPPEQESQTLEFAEDIIPQPLAQ